RARRARGAWPSSSALRVRTSKVPVLSVPFWPRCIRRSGRNDLLARSGAVVQLRGVDRGGVSGHAGLPFLWSSLYVSDELVGQENKVVEGPGPDEAHRLLVASLAEEALAGPEHDRGDPQSPLVGEVPLAPCA